MSLYVGISANPILEERSLYGYLSQAHPPLVTTSFFPAPPTDGPTGGTGGCGRDGRDGRAEQTAGCGRAVGRTVGRLDDWPIWPIGRLDVRADWPITDILRSLPITRSARLADYPQPIAPDWV